MERTKYANDRKLTTQQLQAFASELVGRANLMARMGMQYSGSRDLYKALGYKKDLVFDDYLAKYQRHDMAKAIIDRPVRATWQGSLEMVESDKPKDTEFETTWDTLNRKLGIKSILSRVDRLTGIGRYGILFLGLDDVSSVNSLVNPVNEGKVKNLLYLKPFGESSAKISKLVETSSDERYGKPLLYEIVIQDVKNKNEYAVKVHHSRIIHIVDDPLESEVYGTPRLEAVFNRLMDLEKLVGGDAEMFWRNARPGYSGEVNPDFQMTEGMKHELVKHLDEYEHDLRRFLIQEGVTIKALEQQIADPKSHFSVQVSCLSAVTGIPQRVLMGSERGELASTQDTSEWKDYVQGRREDHAEPNIVCPFVDRMIALGILPKPGKDYTVKWSDLYAVSEKERVEVGKARANALREYTYNPIAQGIIPPPVFYEYFLGFTKEQITLTEAMRDQIISEEELANKIIETIDAETTKSEPFGGGGGAAQTDTD